jgi:hypothetical protein
VSLTSHFRLSARKSVAAGLLLTCLIFAPTIAHANNVSNAAPPPPLGGSAIMGTPLDGHQVYKMYLKSGDWIIAYAWAPGTRDATGSVGVLDSTATDVASDTVATSVPSGILFWRVPEDGVYYCDFAAEPGSHILRGLFLSRPQLSLAVPRSVIVPYKADVTLYSKFTDSLYRYVPYDGPVVGFETVALESRSADASWKRVTSGSSDVNGRVRCTARAVAKRTTYTFDYPGAVYESAAFGETRSSTVVVFPRFRITQRMPLRVWHSRTFIVSGEVQPKCNPGITNITAEAHTRGSSKLFKFAVRAYSASGGSTPIRSAVRLPSSGTWYVRLHRPTDANNAETATKWVKVVVL